MMRRVVVALVLASCAHSREVTITQQSSTQREGQQATQATEKTHETSTVTTGPTDTVTVKADFGPADGGVEAPTEITLPPTGQGLPPRTVKLPRPPAGRTITHLEVTEQRTGPIVATAAKDATAQQATQERTKEAGTTKGSEKLKEKSSVGLSLFQKLGILAAVLLVVIGIGFVLRRVPQAALLAIPLVGVPLAFLGGLLKSKPPPSQGAS